MQYYSLRRQSAPVDFRIAAITGQAPDGGLYYPQHLPSHAFAADMAALKDMDTLEIAEKVMQPFVGDTMPAEVLRRILNETLSFPFPLVQLNEQIFSLELFHGPTLAFKDVGARFMSRCLAYFNEGNTRKVTVLVATSGDTGGAVAHGFEGVDGVEVIILYPSGKVSPVQELQLTTCGNNVHALEVSGSFDDCQAMVKQAFTDHALNQQYQLTSANSINVARWLPQQLYYFMALRQWPYAKPPVICVPSGNFGNLCAGMVAHQSGLPVKHFIAACNANDVIPRFMRTGELQELPAKATLSNAMDVARPSNFERIMEMYAQEASSLKTMFSATSVDDATTLATIARADKDYHYMTDPHGAVALFALEQYLQQHPGQQGIFLETAHPVKFPDVMKQALNRNIPVPEAVMPLFAKSKRSTQMDASFADLKTWLHNRV